MTNTVDVNYIRELFDKRDQIVYDMTLKLLSELSPPILAPLHDLFGVDDDDISWMDLQLVDDVIILICTVAFDMEHASPFLKQLFEDTTPGMKTRMIRIGIPLEFITKSEGEVIEFLLKGAENTTIWKPSHSEVSPHESFDTSMLTPEQLQQLELFSTVKGDKH